MVAVVLTAKAVLRQNYLFRQLSESTLEQLAAIAHNRSYRKKEIIFQQGDEAHTLYAIAAGRVRVSASRPDGREMYLKIMEAGDTLGEIAVLDGLPRTAGATAIEDSVLITIRREPFLELVQQNPEFSTHLLRLLCERLRWTTDLLEETSLLGAEARLARRLCILAALHGRSTDLGSELDITQADLAQFLSISRQIVNQHLQDWRARGWVDLAPKKVIVRDAAALNQIADPSAGR